MIRVRLQLGLVGKALVLEKRAGRGREWGEPIGQGESQKFQQATEAETRGRHHTRGGVEVSTVCKAAIGTGRARINKGGQRLAGPHLSRVDRFVSEATWSNSYWKAAVCVSSCEVRSDVGDDGTPRPAARQDGSVNPSQLRPRMALDPIQGYGAR